MRDLSTPNTPSRPRLTRGSRAVLVVDSQALGSIAVIRSLGRAGYCVHACASSTASPSLGQRSRHATAAISHPPYHDGNFLAWLRQYIREHEIQAIVPSEGFLLAIRRCFSEFSHLLPIADDRNLIYTALSKVELFTCLANAPPIARQHLPKTEVLTQHDLPLRSELLATFRYPVFLKVDASHSYSHENSLVIRSDDPEHARASIPPLLARYSKVLVQQFVQGHGVGAFFLMHSGEVQAQFMHLRLHEVPHTGGISSYRRSFLHAAIREDALAKLNELRWQGVAMMEYRWNPHSNDFWLIEMNARFWGSLHLALYADVDFPKLLLDSHFGLESHPVLTYRTDIRCRHMPMECNYLLSILRDRSVRWYSKCYRLLEFVYLGLNPRIHSDLLFSGDRFLYFRNTFDFLVDAVKSAARKILNKGRASSSALLSD